MKENILVDMTEIKCISRNRNITLLNWVSNGTLFNFVDASLQNVLEACLNVNMFEASLFVVINLFQQQIID